MLKLKLFIASVIGVMSMIFFYCIETSLESSFKIDRCLSSQISVLVKNQKIEANAEALINVSFNTFLEK
jgi:hypothetical protein